MQDDTKIDVGDTDEKATEIDLDAVAPEQSLEEEIQVEQVSENDSQSADASKESSEQSDVQASEQKKELDDYSDGVQKRIAKLTRKMREAERQKEEAIVFAEKMKADADKLKARNNNLGDSYTKELESKVTTGMNAAKLAYKQAIESQDIEGQVDAQKAIAQMAMEEARLNNLKQAQEQVKELRGDLQTRDREAVNLRKKVEVEKFKTDMDKMSTRAEAAGTLFEKRLDDNLSTVKTDIRRSLKDTGSPSQGSKEATKK